MKKVAWFQLLLPAICLAQRVQVNSGKNPMSGEQWARLSVAAKQGYVQSVSESQFTPVLQVQCRISKSGKRSTDILLVTGGVALGAIHYVQNLEQPVVDVKMRFDEEKPKGKVFIVLEDSSTLLFSGGRHDIFQTEGALLKNLLAARTVYVEFPPYGGAGSVVSQFDVSVLQEEFSKHSECAVR